MEALSSSGEDKQESPARATHTVCELIVSAYVKQLSCFPVESYLLFRSKKYHASK